MRIRKFLEARIEPPVFMMPDEAPGGGGGGTGVADPGADPGGSGADPNIDIIEFEAPDPAAITEAITKGGEIPKPGTKGKKDTPPKKDDPSNPPPKDKKDDDTPPGEPPVAKLREQYEATKKELEELKKTHAAGDPRVKALEKERDDAKAEWEAEKKKRGEYEEQISLMNPAVTKELKELDDAYNGVAAKFYTRVPEMNTGVVNELVKQYAKLPFNTPEFRAAHTEFEKAVNKALGGDDEKEHKRLDATMEFISETYDFATKRPGIEKSARENHRKLVLDADRKTYTSRKTEIADLISKSREVPEDLIKANPNHPRVALLNFDKAIGEDKAKELDANIEEFIHLALNGHAPRSEEDYAGMTDAQVKESKAREAKQVKDARDHLVHVLHLGSRWIRRAPFLVAELARLREKVGEELGGDPPPPDDPNAGGGGGGGDAGDDLAKFKAPPIPDSFG